MSLQDNLTRIRYIAALLPDDDPDKIEMMNVEGDYEKLMRWALIKRNEFIATADAADDLVKSYTARKNSFAKKADNMKNIVSMLMESAGETKFTCEVATASIRKVAPKPIIIDEDSIPDEYFNIKKTIDKKAINVAIKDKIMVDGVTMDNGGVSLMIRV